MQGGKKRKRNIEFYSAKLSKYGYNFENWLSKTLAQRIMKSIKQGVRGMSVLQKIEAKVGQWLKPVPHLPQTAQKWIATNAWWIVLIGVVVSAIGILVAIGGIFTYLAFVGNAASYYGIYSVSAYGPGWILDTIASLILTIVIVILSALAISPVKSLSKKGWDLLFIVFVLKGVGVVLSAILGLNIIGFFFGIIFGAIGLAIGAYFLYEIRSYFGGTAKVVTAKTAHKK